MVGTFDPMYSTNHIWWDDDMEDCLTQHVEGIEADVTALETGKAATNHTHTEYALTDHTHTGYAPVVHSHSGYALASDVSALQTQVGDTSVSAQISAAISTKADANHTHTEYAAVNHIHNEYASSDHTHTGYASSTHTHSYDDLTDKPTIPTSLPANGGNADTVDGKHANEFATNDHTHTGYAAAADVTALQNLVGDTAVSTQISTAIAGKVDAVNGMGLSSNDYTTAEKTKLAGIEAGANNITVDSALSSTSTNPVQNKVIKTALDGKANTSHTHNVFSSLTQIGITTFPTTMRSVAIAMPQNSMIIMDTRRINGTGTEYGTETISDWGTTLNGVAIILKGVTVARLTMMIMYGTVTCTTGQIKYGNYAYDNDDVNWDDLDVQLDSKVDKVKTYSAVDLNTITTSGLYYVSSETTALHCPAGTNGHMLVMSDGTRVRQVFFRVGTVDTNSFQWYSRHLGSDPTVGDNGWSQWWLLSGCELAWSGTAKLNAEINLGSRYGCQAWVVAGQVTDTGTYSTVYIPRYFLTTNTTKYKMQIADETGYVSFYFYYKESDDNVYAKIVWVSDSTNSALKYVYRVS